MKFKFLDKKTKEWNLTANQKHELEKLINDNHDIIKSMNVNLSNFNDFDEIVEAIYSLIDIKTRNNVKKAIPKELMSLKSKKVSDIIVVLLNYVSIDYLRQLLLKNRKDLKTSEEIERFLFKEYRLYVDSSKRDVENKVKNLEDIKVIVNESGLMVLNIKSYESFMQINPSKNWCIAKNKQEFDAYRKDYGEFYILINYMKDVSSKNYMIGFNKGNSFVAFNNSNKRVYEEEIKDVLGKYVTLVEKDLKKEQMLLSREAKGFSNKTYTSNDLEKSIARNKKALESFMRS